MAGFEVTLYGRFWVTPEAIVFRLKRLFAFYLIVAGAPCFLKLQLQRGGSVVIFRSE